MAHLGVDRVGKVHGRGSRGQANDFPLGGKHVDLFGADFIAQGLQELCRIRGLGLPVRKVSKPGHVCLVGKSIFVLARGGSLLVFPVRSNAEFSSLVHLDRADLNLYRTALRPKNRGVERLIEIELGGGNVVLETSWHGIPSRVDCPEDRVTISNRGDQDSDPGEIVDVVEITTSVDHFLVDGIELLGPTTDICLDLGLPQILVDSIDDAFHVGVTLGRAVLDQ